MTDKLPDGWEEVPLFKYLELVSSGVKQFQGTKKYIDTGALETGRIRGALMLIMPLDQAEQIWKQKKEMFYLLK